MLNRFEKGKSQLMSGTVPTLGCLYAHLSPCFLAKCRIYTKGEKLKRTCGEEAAQMREMCQTFGITALSETVEVWMLKNEYATASAAQPSPWTARHTRWRKMTERTTFTAACGALTSASGRQSRWRTVCGCAACRPTARKAIPAH